MRKALYLIDGSAFAYRAFFAIRGLTNSKGQPTNAVFGFARVLIKLLREHDPSHIAVVFDAPGKTFRDELYAEYKATRQEMPAELRSQFPLIHDLVNAFDIRLIMKAGVEADDVLGTLARRAEEAGMEAVLVTGDKDALQLVTENVKVYDPSKVDEGQWIGIPEVIERFGVPPEAVIDALGLMGDSSDNVPGVRGIGPKSAKELLQKYGTIAGIYEHLDELKGKQRERLEEDREIAKLSRLLCTIDTNVSLDETIDDCRRQELDKHKLIEAFSTFEFQTLLDEFLPKGAADAETQYTLVTTETLLNAVVAEMRAAGEFSVDTETTSTDPMRADLVGISLSCKPNAAYYVPVGHTPEAYSLLRETVKEVEQLPKAKALELLRTLFADEGIGKIGHNIKYDAIVLEREGAPLQGIRFDTMVASYLTDPSRMRHNLDEVSLHYLKCKLIPISDLIGKGSKSITFDSVPVDQACTYACEDADIAGRLAEVFRPLLQERGLMDLFDQVELPLIGVLARMEMAGVAIGREVFAGLRLEVETRLRALEKDIYETAGEPFQINSPKQLQEILFGKLGLKPTRKTKTGYSTDVEVLEELAQEHPLPKKILEYRTFEKLRGTYIEALPKLVHPVTGRIHTSFNQAVAATGRLSSSDPNLQNIPVRTDIGRRIRQGFVPGDAKHKLISADYSQIELRILAHLSGDEYLREAFLQDADIHRDTAARVFGVLPELVDGEMRRRAKAVNFGVIYGMSAFGLARNLGIPQAEAARFIDQYFATYPKVKSWITATLTQAAKDGYVTTLLRRRRYVPDLTSGNMMTRKGAERIAVNTPVQGSAADIIKLAMITLDKKLRGTRSRLILQVHDELVVEAPAEDAESIAGTVRHIMENAYTLNVPVKVDVGFGDNWADIH